MTVLPELIYRFSVAPVKIPAALLTEIDKLVFKLIWKCKTPRVGKIILKKNNAIGGLTLPHFLISTLTTKL